MVETSLSVAELQRLISRVGPDEGRRLVVGCALDDGTSLETVPIVGLDWPAALLLAGGRRGLFARLRGGLVVDERPGAPLLTAVETTRSPAELVEQDERHILVQAGVDVDKLGGPDGRRAVSTMLANLTARLAPSYEVRHASYLALRTAADQRQARVAAGLFRRAMDLHKADGLEVPGDYYWRLTWFLRSCGELRGAVATSSVLFDRHVQLPSDRKILAVTRAWALIDLWHSEADSGLLLEAQRAFNVAYAIDSRDEATRVLGRVLTAAMGEARVTPSR
jgi:hypothetical protein